MKVMKMRFKVLMILSLMTISLNTKHFEGETEVTANADANT